MAKKVKCVFAVVFAVLTLAFWTLFGWIYWGNAAVQVTSYTVSSTDLPSNFSGYRIAQVSDLHNQEFGEENERLLELLRQAEPDIIAITGDLVDSKEVDVQTA